jgi:hypothetical protein
MKSSIFCDRMPFSPLKVNQCFGGSCHSIFMVERISQKSSRRSFLTTCYNGDFSGVLFFYPEDIGDMYLRDVG